MKAIKQATAISGGSEEEIKELRKIPAKQYPSLPEDPAAAYSEIESILRMQYAIGILGPPGNGNMYESLGKVSRFLLSDPFLTQTEDNTIIRL